MILVKHSRALARAGLLFLMFALGIVLVALFKSQPPPPQAQLQEPPVSAPQRQEPKSPSEVVETYWNLSAEGDIDGANRHWSGVTRAGEFVKLHAMRGDWAVVIYDKKWKLAKIEREVMEGEDTAYVVASVTSDRAPFIPRVKNELVKIKGEWKIVSIYTHRDY